MSVEAASIRNQPLRRLTRVEYDRLVAQGVFADERVELVFGMVVAMSPIDPKHVQSTARLHKRVTIAIGDRAGLVEVRRDRDAGTWRSITTYRRGDTIHMLAFPDVTVSVDEILPPL